VRLVRAEAYMGTPGLREEGVAALRLLGAGPGEVGARATALLRALGG
jgi:hypothetical protein